MAISRVRTMARLKTRLPTLTAAMSRMRTEAARSSHKPLRRLRPASQVKFDCKSSASGVRVRMIRGDVPSAWNRILWSMGLGDTGAPVGISLSTIDRDRTVFLENGQCGNEFGSLAILLTADYKE